MTGRAHTLDLAAWLSAALVVVGAAAVGSRSHWPALLALVVLGVTAVIAWHPTGLLLAVFVAGVLQLPIGDAGGVPGIQFFEFAAPVMAGVVAIRLTLGRQPPRSVFEGGLARRVDVAVLVLAGVVVLNFARSRFFMTPLISAGVDRTFIDYVAAFALYFVARYAVLNHPARGPLLLRSALAVSGVVCAVGLIAVAAGVSLDLGSLRYSIYDYSSGAVRAGFLEIFALTGIAVAAVRPMRFRIAWVMLFALALVVSGGRATTIGAVVAIVVYLALTKRSLVLAPVIASAILISFAAPGIVQNSQFQRLSSLGSGTFAADGRSFIYDRSFAAFKQHPLTGTGVGRPEVVFDPRPQVAQFYEAQLEVGGHATYAALMKNFGLAGILPFLAMVAFSLAGLMREARNSELAGFFLVMLTGLAVSMVGGGNGSDPALYFVLGGSAATIAGSRRGVGQASPESRSGDVREAAHRPA